MRPEDAPDRYSRRVVPVVPDSGHFLSLGAVAAAVLDRPETAAQVAPQRVGVQVLVAPLEMLLLVPVEQAAVSLLRVVQVMHLGVAVAAAV